MPRWRADSREIFFAGPTALMAAPVVVGGASHNPSLRGFGFVDASRDGRELLFARHVAGAAPRSPVKVLINWMANASRW